MCLRIMHVIVCKAPLQRKSVNWEKDTEGYNWFKMNKNNTDYLVGRNVDRETDIYRSK